MAGAKPEPVRDVWNAPFLDGFREKRLRLPFCAETGQFFFPPGPVSPFTGKPCREWRDASGRGTLWSYVVFHQNYFAGFADEVPYPVLMVKLDEGPFLIANLRGRTPADLRIGQRVRAVFDEDEMSLLQFSIESDT